MSWTILFSFHCRIQAKIFMSPLLFPRRWFLVFRESCTSCLVHNASRIDVFMYNKNTPCCSHHSFPTHAPHCSVDSVPASPACLSGASPLPWRETECGIILLWQIKAGYRWAWTGAAWFTLDCRSSQLKNSLCLDWSTSNINSLQNSLFQHLKKSPGAHWCTDRGKGFNMVTYRSECPSAPVFTWFQEQFTSRHWFEIPWGKRGGVHLAHKFQQWATKCVFATQISATSHLMTSMWHFLPWKGGIFHFWRLWPTAVEQSFRSSVLLH